MNTTTSFASASAPLSPPESVAAGTRIVRFFLAVGGLLLVMYVLAPLAVEHIAPLKQYARVVDETGITPGALYYTDVPQSTDAEMNNRDALRYKLDKQN